MTVRAEYRSTLVRHGLSIRLAGTRNERSFLRGAIGRFAFIRGGSSTSARWLSACPPQRERTSNSLSPSFPRSERRFQNTTFVNITSKEVAAPSSPIWTLETSANHSRVSRQKPLRPWARSSKGVERNPRAYRRRQSAKAERWLAIYNSAVPITSTIGLDANAPRCFGTV